MPMVKKLVLVLLVWGLVVVALLLDLEVSSVARLEFATNLRRSRGIHLLCDCETSNFAKNLCEL